MAGWEYLFLVIKGHNDGLDSAKNTLVWTSDGRWNETKMPKDVIGIVNSLGAEGWEMVASNGSTGERNWVAPVGGYDAVFKRPIV